MLLNCTETQRSPFRTRTAGSENRNRPTPNRNRTEPNWGHPAEATIPKRARTKSLAYEGMGADLFCLQKNIRKWRGFCSKVPEGHHPRGTTLREALRGNLPLRGLCGGLSEGSAASLRGFCRVVRGFCGGPRDFPKLFGGSDPMLVTLKNCWILAREILLTKQRQHTVHDRALEPLTCTMAVIHICHNDRHMALSKGGEIIILFWAILATQSRGQHVHESDSPGKNLQNSLCACAALIKGDFPKCAFLNALSSNS